MVISNGNSNDVAILLRNDYYVTNNIILMLSLLSRYFE